RFDRGLHTRFGDMLDQPRQAHDELAAFARALAHRLDGAAMHFDQALDECQADAEATLRTIMRMAQLPEQIEDARARFRRNADTGVAHATYDVLAVALRLEIDATALVGIFRCVVEQI